MHILVADDEEHCRKLLRALFLNEPEVQLTMARDGAEAWWHLTAPNARYNLGIFDLRMPGIDGLALLERIRTSPQHRSLPVIMCTGVHDRETVARAAHLTVNSYVIKPFKADSLRQKINSIVPALGLGRPAAIAS